MLDTTIILHLIIMFMYLTILSVHTATHMWPNKVEEGTVNYSRSLSTKMDIYTYSSTHSNLPCSLSTSFFPGFKMLHLKIKSKRKTKTNLSLNTMSTIHKIHEQVQGLAVFFWPVQDLSLCKWQVRSTYRKDDLVVQCSTKVN